MSQLTRQLLHTLRKESEECFRRGDYKEGDELQRIAIRKAMEYLVAQVKEDPGIGPSPKNSFNIFISFSYPMLESLIAPNLPSLVPDVGSNLSATNLAAATIL